MKIKIDPKFGRLSKQYLELHPVKIAFFHTRCMQIIPSCFARFVQTRREGIIIYVCWVQQQLRTYKLYIAVIVVALKLSARSPQRCAGKKLTSYVVGRKKVIYYFWPSSFSHSIQSPFFHVMSSYYCSSVVTTFVWNRIFWFCNLLISLSLLFRPHCFLKAFLQASH